MDTENDIIESLDIIPTPYVPPSKRPYHRAVPEDHYVATRLALVFIEAGCRITVKEGTTNETFDE